MLAFSFLILAFVLLIVGRVLGIRALKHLTLEQKGQVLDASIHPWFTTFFLIFVVVGAIFFAGIMHIYNVNPALLLALLLVFFGAIIILSIVSSVIYYHKIKAAGIPATYLRIFVWVAWMKMLALFLIFVTFFFKI